MVQVYMLVTVHMLCLVSLGLSQDDASFDSRSSHCPVFDWLHCAKMEVIKNWTVEGLRTRLRWCYSSCHLAFEYLQLRLCCASLLSPLSVCMCNVLCIAKEAEHLWVPWERGGGEDSVQSLINSTFRWLWKVSGQADVLLQWAEEAPQQTESEWNSS